MFLRFCLLMPFPAILILLNVLSVSRTGQLGAFGIIWIHSLMVSNAT